MRRTKGRTPRPGLDAAAAASRDAGGSAARQGLPCGHLLQEEAPDALLQALAPFLAAG